MDLMSTANAAAVFGLLCFMVVKEVITRKNGNGGTNGKVSRTEHEMLMKLTKIEAHQEKTCELLQQMLDRI
jgi:hypothetical protein